MKLRTFSYIIAAALTGTALAGAATRSGSVINHGNKYTVVTPERTVRVDVLSSDIMRVTSLPKSSDVKYSRSQSAIMEPEDTQRRSILTDSTLVIATPTTILMIDRQTGKVKFLNPEGKILIAEETGVINDGEIKTVSLRPASGQLYYGAGERGHSLTLNGDSLSMYNRQNYGYTEGDTRISQMGISVPWFSSDAGYGILFDDYNKASLELKDVVTYTSETPRPLSYYFVNGNGTLAGTGSNYARLTGHQSLPPFWTMGYITSKYGYHNSAETYGAVDSLKRDGYPLDGLVLDLYWYGMETDMGRLDWDKKQWPDHKKMLDDLQKEGVNVVLISQPYINKIGALDNYNLLDSHGMLTHDDSGKTHDVTTWVGEAGMFDMANPDTRKWLWNRLKGLTAEGVDGWWGDLGEPEVHPQTIVHANGETASQYHNVYGNEWSRTIYEGLRRDFPQMRPMLMMRGGTAGLQRYSVFPWTTDVSRSWGGLKPQVKLMLSSGLSGLGYMSSDLGGFAVDPAHPYDPELYVRWVETGPFTPIFRTHAQQKPEPYHYPKQKNLLKKIVRTRYEWLPYNYTLAYENASEGLPLARPLNFRGENPGKQYASVHDEYLWGDNVLVAPVTDPGVKRRSVLFPKGEWISWYNPAMKYAGGKRAVVPAPLGQVPLFVKAGSFIPQYPREIANTGEYDPSELTVRFYPTAETTKYTLFDDDRKSPTSLENGAYALINFSGSLTNGKLTVNVDSKGSYEGIPEERDVTFEVYGIARKPRTVTINGTAAPVAGKTLEQGTWSYNAATSMLSIRVDLHRTQMVITAN